MVLHVIRVDVDLVDIITRSHFCVVHTPIVYIGSNGFPSYTTLQLTSIEIEVKFKPFYMLPLTCFHLYFL